MNDYYLNAGRAAVTPALICLLLMRAGLVWEMHPAQVFSMEAQALQTETVNEVAIEVDEKVRELMPRTTGITLMGIPVIVKQDYPMSLIRLMCNGVEVSRIEALSVPNGFMNNLNWEEQQESEHKKMESIGFRTWCGKQ